MFVCNTDPMFQKCKQHTFIFILNTTGTQGLTLIMTLESYAHKSYQHITGFVTATPTHQFLYLPQTLHSNQISLSKLFSKSDLLVHELSWGWAGLRGYNTVQCFLCSIGVPISHPEKDYKDKEPVSPNCTSMVVHTGIIFDTTAATRVVIKVNDVAFKYVQLQHFPMEHLTT